MPLRLCLGEDESRLELLHLENPLLGLPGLQVLQLALEPVMIHLQGLVGLGRLVVLRLENLEALGEGGDLLAAFGVGLQGIDLALERGVLGLERLDLPFPQPLELGIGLVAQPFQVRRLVPLRGRLLLRSGERLLGLDEQDLVDQSAPFPFLGLQAGDEGLVRGLELGDPLDRPLELLGIDRCGLGGESLTEACLQALFFATEGPDLLVQGVELGDDLVGWGRGRGGRGGRWCGPARGRGGIGGRQCLEFLRHVAEAVGHHPVVPLGIGPLEGPEHLLGLQIPLPGPTRFSPLALGIGLLDQLIGRDEVVIRSGNQL